MVKQPHGTFVFAHWLVLEDVILDGTLCDDVLFAVRIQFIHQVLVGAAFATVRLAQALDQEATTGVLLISQVQHLRALAQSAGQGEGGCKRGGVVPLARFDLNAVVRHLVFPQGTLKGAIPRPNFSAGKDGVVQAFGEKLTRRPQLWFFVADCPRHAKNFGRRVRCVVVPANGLQIGLAVRFVVDMDSCQFSIFLCAKFAKHLTEIANLVFGSSDV